LTPPIYGQRPETLFGLQAQGLSLAHRALSLANQTISSGPQDFATLDLAIENYIARLPGLRNGGDSGEILATPGLSPINHQVVFIRTLGYTASLVLHHKQQRSLDDASSYRCSVAAHNIASIISELSFADYGSVFIGLGHAWFAAGQVLVSLSRRLGAGAGQQYQDSAVAVVNALKQLSKVYLPLGFQYKQLHRSIYGSL